MAIADLVANVAGSLGAAINGPKQIPKYPTFPEIGVNYTDVKPEHWFSPPKDTYQLTVETAADAQKEGESLGFVETITSFFNAPQDTGDFGPFKFPIPPQEIKQSEEFAVSIRPSQGGTIVNHSGNKYKTLTLSGTTGVQPFRGLTGVDRFTGRPFFQPDELKYRSGYEVFIHLRAWIKAYHEHKKRNPVDARELRMIWKNFKDWEFLIVEPLSFVMERSAQSPLEYNYAISFKVTGHLTPPKPNLNFFEEIDKALQQATNALETAKGLMLKGQEIVKATAGEINGVIEKINQVNLAVKAAGGFALSFSDASKKIIFNATTALSKLSLTFSVLQAIGAAQNSPSSFEAGGGDWESLPDDPTSFTQTLNNKAQGNLSDESATAVLEEAIGLQKGTNNLPTLPNIPIGELPEEVALALLEGQEQAALDTTPDSVAELKEEIIALATEFGNAIGLGDDTINLTKGFTPPAETGNVSEITDQAIEILYAFQQAVVGLDSILSSDVMFDSNAALFSRADSSNGAESIGEGIFFFPDPNTGVREGIVPLNATLEKIAQIELGNSSRWTEIAELNGLKFPYILTDENDDQKVNYTVRSVGFTNPTDIKNLTVGFLFVVAESPTPAGAWLGRATQVAEYQGGDKTQASSWRFFIPPEGTIVQALDREETYLFQDSGWELIELDTYDNTAILRPGDIIKIPSNQPPSPSSQSRGPRDNRFTTGLSATEKALQVDLRLNRDDDLDLNPSGDLSAVAGFENGAQAVILKLAYERRDLIKFPSIGAGLTVGRKVPDLAELRSQVYSSLIQDDRILDVRNIQLDRLNGTMNLKFDVIFKQIQDPVPITIPV